MLNHFANLITNILRILKKSKYIMSINQNTKLKQFLFFFKYNKYINSRLNIFFELKFLLFNNEFLFIKQ